MLKIGDAAKQYNISNRTLRYWEEQGILASTRTENGYRFYDDSNAQRIKQIVLLRKLKLPIAKIEKIFISNSVAVTVATLTEHLNSLKQETAAHHSLSIITEQLIRRLPSEKNMEQVFLYLEASVGSALLEHKDALQILLSERNSNMLENQLDNVRIVKLPAMLVASYRAEGATPEEDCSKVFNKFVLENGLHKRDGYRFFGFNNPSPSEASPIYGYEMWVTIPADLAVPSPLEKKQFDGGLYASISTRMNEIGERWQLLYNWSVNNTKYEADISSQWLEECSMDFEVFISDTVNSGEKQLDLLAPIKGRLLPTT